MTAAADAVEGWTALSGVDATVGVTPARARLGDEHILVVRTPGGWRGLERACPHQGATLIDAKLVGAGRMLRCAQHNYTFRLDDGRGVNCPGYRIRVYEVREQDGRLFARPAGEADGSSGAHANDPQAPQ